MKSDNCSSYWMYGIYILIIPILNVHTLPLSSHVMKWQPDACDRETYFRYNGCNETASVIYRRNCAEIRRLLKDKGIFHQSSSYELLNAPDRYQLPNNDNPAACIEDIMLTLSQTTELLQNLRNYQSTHPRLGTKSFLGRKTSKSLDRRPAGASEPRSEGSSSRERREIYRVRRGALALPENKWTSPIRYKVDSEIVLQSAWMDAVQSAVEAWSNGTCLNFEQIPVNTNLSQPHLLFTLLFFPSCSSYIGQIPGIVPQPIYLGVLCYTPGVIAHELGHALGLIHEHQRPDRDSYITLVPENRVGSSDSYFALFNSSMVQTYDQPYDYGSDMHYGGTAYSFNGSLTIKTNDPLFQGTLGQREELSFWDIYAINLAYCADVCQSTELQKNCLNRGYQDPRNCSSCRCPTGWTGQYCDAVAPPINASCGATLIQLSTSNVGTVRFPLMSGANSSSPYSPGQQCTWSIESPPNTSILFQFQDDFGVSCSSVQGNMCLDWVEVRYQLDLGLSGPRFCCDQRPAVELVSASNRLLVIFKALSQDALVQQRRGFTFSYQINVDCRVTPCLNSGQCIRNTAGRFTCQCLAVSSGSLCETDQTTTRIKLAMTPPVDTTIITTTLTTTATPSTSTTTTTPSTTTTSITTPSTSTITLTTTSTTASASTPSTSTQITTKPTQQTNKPSSQIISTLTSLTLPPTSSPPSTSTTSTSSSPSSPSPFFSYPSSSSSVSRRQTPTKSTTTTASTVSTTATTTNQASNIITIETTTASQSILTGSTQNFQNLQLSNTSPAVVPFSPPWQSTPGLLPLTETEELPTTTTATSQIKTTDYFHQTDAQTTAVNQPWITTNYFKESITTQATGAVDLQLATTSFVAPRSNIVSVAGGEALSRTTTSFMPPRSNILTEYPFKSSTSNS